MLLLPSLHEVSEPRQIRSWAAIARRWPVAPRCVPRLSTSPASLIGRGGSATSRTVLILRRNHGHSPVSCRTRRGVSTLRM